jgi:proline iminopeptidase
MAEHLVAGRRAFYEAIGSGPPLAVVHGGLGKDHTYFRPWLDPLAERYTVIYVDLLGNGRSEEPEGLASQTDVQPWVDQLDALRLHLGLERWTVLGHSFGGFVVQTYATQHASDLDGFVVCCSSPVVDHFEASFALAQQVATPAQLETLTQRLFAVPMKDDAHFARVSREVYPSYFAHPDRVPLDRLSGDVIYRANAYNAAVRILSEIDLRDALPAATSPSSRRTPSSSARRPPGSTRWNGRSGCPPPSRSYRGGACRGGAPKAADRARTLPLAAPALVREAGERCRRCADRPTATAPAPSSCCAPATSTGGSARRRSRRASRAPTPRRRRRRCASC